MNFKEAESLVYGRLDNLNKKGKGAVKVGLANIKKLCDALGNPHLKFKSVHVAGTNGKGSVSNILAATFQKAGYKVGLTTSPHLIDIRERVRINGAIITKKEYVTFVEKVLPLMDTIRPSYYELNIAMAFYFFAKAQVDIAIIETGLGGRLDSTNIITPELSVITNIALDHTDILGDTLEKIAEEKAGIIKSGVPVVIGKTQLETESVFFQKAHRSESLIIYADTVANIVKLPHGKISNTAFYTLVDLSNHKTLMVETDLLGDFQQENIVTSFAAIQVMKSKGWNLTDEIYIEALKSVKQLTGLKGRWDYFKDYIILDVAHNPDGIKQLIQNVNRLNISISLIYGSVSDKDVEASVCLLREVDAKIYLTEASVPRALPVQQLEQYFAQLAIPTHNTQNTVAASVKLALAELDKGTPLVIAGSFFVVGEAYRALEALFLGND